MTFWRSATVRYLVYGASFGALFPLLATTFDIWLRGLPFTLASAGVAQSTQPLHWMIDTAPLFLGLFAALAGWRQERLEVALRRALQAEDVARLHAENAQLYVDAQSQLDELRRLHQNLEDAAQTIRRLSVPLIPVRQNIVALPLIGAFDRARTVELRTSVLNGIHERRTRIVIVDCTGVESIQPEALEELVNLFDALALLGAKTLLCGVSAELAPRLAEQLGQRAIVTAPDLSAGIDRALELRDLAEQ